jgi:hypothetical protein
MMNGDPNTQTELLSFFAQLPAYDQAKVVDFARSLVRTPNRGTPGKDLLKIVGLIDMTELEQMEHAIEEECERVESNGW